jgi:hypothetical protein
MTKPIYKSKRAEAKARLEYDRQRAVEDLRDDTLAIILRNCQPGDRIAIARAFASCEANHGPTAATLWKWFHKEVAAPKLTSLRAALRAVGHDLGIVSQRQRHS